MAEEDQRQKRRNNPKSYQVRKECIKRKSMELAVLCDIKVCTVITGPRGELQTWPENLDAVKEVLDLYTQNLKPEKNEQGSSKPQPQEEEGEKDILTLVEAKLEAVNKRIRFLENHNVADRKGKKPRVE